MLGVAPDTVSRWARGRAAPGAAHVARLAELLNISSDDLLYKSPAGTAVLPATAIPIAGRATAGPLTPDDTPPAEGRVSVVVAGLLVTIIVQPSTQDVPKG
jgi:transcriptional regulator with XRE-family HTH domain